MLTLYIQPGFQVPGKPRCFSGSPFVIKQVRNWSLGFALKGYATSRAADGIRVPRLGRFGMQWRRQHRIDRTP